MKHIFKIVLEGFIPSLTGGWYYDARQCHFTNTVHLYLWLALFCTPIILHLTLAFSYIVWVSYSLAVGVMFTVIKLINLRMHHLYDINKAINEEFVEEQAGAPSDIHEEPDLEAARPEEASEVQEAEEVIDDGDNQPASIKYVQLKMLAESDAAGTSSGSRAQPRITDCGEPSTHSSRQSPVLNAAATSKLQPRITDSGETAVFNAAENDYVALLKRSQSARASSHGSAPLNNDRRPNRPSKLSDEARALKNTADSSSGAAVSPKVSTSVRQSGGATGGPSGTHRTNSRSIHRTASDCSSALQRLRAMHAELASINCADFSPSMRDLEALDTNPRRALTTAISRSRSSSQRHRRPPSVRSIGRFLVTGATPTSASAAPSATPTPGSAVTGRRMHVVERSQSLRSPQSVTVERGHRVQGQAVPTVVPPRRTQSLRQSTERAAALPSLPQLTSPTVEHIECKDVTSSTTEGEDPTSPKLTGATSSKSQENKVTSPKSPTDEGAAPEQLRSKVTSLPRSSTPVSPDPQSHGNEKENIFDDKKIKKGFDSEANDNTDADPLPPSENSEKREVAPEPPCANGSMTSSERSLISICSWLFDQEASVISDGSLSSGEIPDPPLAGAIAVETVDDCDDQIELNPGLDEQSLERLASELPSNLLRVLEDSGPAERRNIISLLNRVIREALTSSGNAIAPLDATLDAVPRTSDETSEQSSADKLRAGSEAAGAAAPSETSSSHANENTVLIPRKGEPTTGVSLSPRMESDLADAEVREIINSQMTMALVLDRPEEPCSCSQVPQTSDSPPCNCRSFNSRGLRRRNCVKNRGGTTGRRRSNARQRPPSPELECTCSRHEEPREVAGAVAGAAAGAQQASGENFETSAFAHNHDDTSEGAVHYFQDENGELMVYMFGDHLGTAMSWTDYIIRYPNLAGDKDGRIPPNITRPSHPMENDPSYERTRGHVCTSSRNRGQARRAPTPTPVRRSSVHSMEMHGIRPDNVDLANKEDPDRIVRVPDCCDDDDDESADEYGGGVSSWVRANICDLSPSSFARPLFRRNDELARNLREYDEISHYLANTSTINWSNRRADSQNSIRAIICGSPTGRNSRTGHYKMQLMPGIKKNVKLHFGRLQLMALFDRNATVVEMIMSVLLAIVVGMLGGLVLNTGLYVDLSIFALCFYMAASQYSLVKSVQPDSSSPIHGFNRITVFSRAFYFILTATLLLITTYALQSVSPGPPIMTFYGISLTRHSVLTFIQTYLKYIFIFSPVLFLLGLLPQANTFCTYVLEHIDIHVFGGSGTTGLLAAFISLLKNLLVVALGYGLCFVGLRAGDPQHAVFSIYCGVHLALCYILSRSATNPALYKDLFSNCPKSCPVNINTESGSCVAKKSSSTVQVDESNAQTPGPSWRQDNEDEATTSEPAASTPVTDAKSASENDSNDDPLPQQLRASVVARLKNDGVMVILIAILGFAVHVSTAFTSLASLSPPAQWPIWVAVVWGAFLHYGVPHLRKTHPWKLFANPIIKPAHSTSICEDPTPRLIPFEKAYVWLAAIERNIIIPVIAFMAITQAAKPLVSKFGLFVAPVILSVCSMKLLRSGFAITSRVYLVLLFTHLAFAFDFKHLSETFLVDTFIVSILLMKSIDFVRKVQFFYVYIAPWQIAWGSAVHAFAQPFFVPHSMLLFLLAFISSIFSTPFQPFLGSAIFLTSYVRPIKFWEQDYNTKRVDNTNTALSAQLDRNTGSRSENLNAIFYEHLTRSLQHSLTGDIMLGRWGDVHHGDFFVMASDELNALVHIIEVGNGYVTFQLRGLELRGTYCQQREVEILREGVGNASQCCCCEVGDSCSCLGKHFICLNAAFQLRSLAWEVISDPYVIDGYSISDQSASHSQQVFELRKILLTLYVKCIIFYAIQSPSLTLWLNSPTIQEALKSLNDQGFVDLDPIFNHHLDADYDALASGISRSSFVSTYIEWIWHCLAKRDDLPEDLDKTSGSLLVSLCLALSLLGRRALSVAAHDNYAAMVDFFLYGLHALFKGDFRITSTKDEWVFVDVDMLYKVVAPALRMGLKLHQDHFANDECLTDNDALFESIQETITSMVICHETDSAWRYAVLNNAPRLLALRHLVEDGTEGYRIIMLTRRHLRFRMARINPECVRGLWAGQQQELVFLRNRNSERGSIQNARQVLRNMISSSCDQPLGYPIFVSPLTTSFAGTHEHYSSVAFHEFSFGRAIEALRNLWRSLMAFFCNGMSATRSYSARDNRRRAYRFSRLRWLCDATCATATSGAMDDINDCGIEMQSFNAPGPNVGPGSGVCVSGGNTVGAVGATGMTVCRGQPARTSTGPSSGTYGKRLQAVATLERSQSDSSRDTVRRDWTLSSDASRPSAAPAPPPALRVTITDPSHIMDGRCFKVLTWPPEEQQHRNRVLLAPLTSIVQANLTGAEGTVLYKWMPCHRDIAQRSFTNKTIYLVKVNNDFVVVLEDGVVILEETSLYNCTPAAEKAATLSSVA